MNLAVKAKLKAVPHDPGCYMMKDGHGTIIYVGKATSLRSRLGHYFGNQERLDGKTQALVAEITDFEVIITRTAVEALLLERTLIKHHKPHYNVLLRDDKEYPYLRVDRNDPWPRIEKVRRRRDDGATYIGPFSNAGQLRSLLEAAGRIFPLIRCSRWEFANAKRPCNYYHMKWCLGPCTLPVPREKYLAMIDDALNFLTGKNPEVLRSLKEHMQRAADAQDYEAAAAYRDQIRAFEMVLERQSVVIGDPQEADAVGLVSEGNKAAFHVLQVRAGHLIGHESFLPAMEMPDQEEALRAFLLQYYDSRSVPAEVLLPFELPDADDMAAALLSSHPERRSIQLRTPQRGSRADLVAMAMRNAEAGLAGGLAAERAAATELSVVREKLRLRRTPVRMECIDISNFQGAATVASCVVFVNGRPAKDLYRIYKVNLDERKPDDFTSITEIVGRRLRRAAEEGDCPDLLLIDGGRGQLNAALKAAADYPHLPLELAALAKSRVDKSLRRESFIDSRAPKRTFERVFLPDQEAPLPLAPGTPEYRLLTRIRDEAHRFAITHHRKKRDKESTASVLTDVKGIGPRLRARLLTEFGGLEGLRQASLDQLRRVRGLREDAAVALFSLLNPEPTVAPDGGTAATNKPQQ